MVSESHPCWAMTSAENVAGRLNQPLTAYLSCCHKALNIFSRIAHQRRDKTRRRNRSNDSCRVAVERTLPAISSDQPPHDRNRESDSWLQRVSRMRGIH